jgi:hypothetical protein
MTEKTNGVIGVPTLISAAAVLFMAFGGGWTLFQSQFAAMGKQLDELKTITSLSVQRKEFDEFQKRFDTLIGDVNRLQAEQHMMVAASARHPIEKETLDVIDADFSKRIDQIEVQIQDINRQIAAALIIIDNNAQRASPKTLLPPDK